MCICTQRYRYTTWWASADFWAVAVRAERSWMASWRMYTNACSYATFKSRPKSSMTHCAMNICPAAAAALENLE